MIYLVIYVECKGNVENRLSGITNFEITQNRKEQVYLLANKLEKLKIFKIYIILLLRVVDTS